MLYELSKQGVNKISGILGYCRNTQNKRIQIYRKENRWISIHGIRYLTVMLFDPCIATCFFS